MGRRPLFKEPRDFTFQAEDSLIAAIEKQAIVEERSMSAIIRRAISAYLSSSVEDFHNRGIDVAGRR